ncbi:MAG TPA: PKD domain-containing protein, partial [Thermoanaerobaculia bacterium]|nr:PKD domain-containing protein [Thermoanaerobaculia bacterium]
MKLRTLVALVAPAALAGAFSAGAESRPLARPLGEKPLLAAEMLLSRGRITASIAYRNPYDNKTGAAQALQQTDEFGYFYFSDPSNPEVFVKALGSNDPTHFQVFVGALTNFEYTATFRGCGGQVVTYTKPPFVYGGFADATTLTLSACSGGGTSPTASFTYAPQNPVLGQSVQFSDTSAGNPATWSWDFGDGSTSSLKNPSHAYGSTGTKTVRLTAANSFGSDTRSNTLVVSPASNQKTISLNFQNNYVARAFIAIDGVESYQLDAGGSGSATYSSSAATATIVMRSSVPTFADGSVIPGAGSVFTQFTVNVTSGASYNLASTASFPSQGVYYYAPLTKNQTSTNIQPVFNLSLTSQYICPCYVPFSGDQAVFLGYYPFFTNSTVAYFRDGQAPNGSYRYFTGLEPYRDTASGAVTLVLSTPPSPAEEPGGIAVPMPERSSIPRDYVRVFTPPTRVGLSDPPANDRELLEVLPAMH